MKKKLADMSEDQKIDALDRATKYLRFIVLVCTFLTILSGVIFYMISEKVSNSISPMLIRMATAEEKVNTYIKKNDKVMETTVKQDIFRMTCKSHDDDIQEIRAQYQAISGKIDDLMRILIEQVPDWVSPHEAKKRRLSPPM